MHKLGHYTKFAFGTHVGTCQRLYSSGRQPTPSILDDIKYASEFEFDRQALELRSQVWAAKYVWKIPLISKNGLQDQLHSHYCDIISIICNNLMPFSTMSEWFDDDIINFVSERGSHPGIPFLSHQSDDKMEEIILNSDYIHNKLIDLKLTADCDSIVDIINQDTTIDDDDDESKETIKKKETSDEELKKRLKGLFKDDDAFQVEFERDLKNRIYDSGKQSKENINEILLNDKENEKKNKNKNGKDLNNEECNFDVILNSEKSLAIYLNVTMLIQHGEEEKWEKHFEPTLVSDFIDVMPTDWNRIFKWDLVTSNPIGYIDFVNMDKKQLNKTRQLFEKLIASKYGNKLSEQDDARYWYNVDILWKWTLRSCCRINPVPKITNWKVIDAQEVSGD